MLPPGRDVSQEVTLIVFTDGRGEYLARTMQSMTEHIAYQFQHALMVDDSGNAQYAAWLDQMFPTFRHIHHAQRVGFAASIRSAWQNVPRCGYLFTLEDDFTFNEDVDIVQLRMILESEPTLAQVVLKRQAWNEAEKEAGGIVELHPDWYTEKEVAGAWISEQSVFYSTNPNLMRYELIQNLSLPDNNIAWPLVDQSEGKYGAWLRKKGYHFAFLGRKFDPPRVEHIGLHRIGGGY